MGPGLFRGSLLGVLFVYSFTKRQRWHGAFLMNRVKLQGWRDIIFHCSKSNPEAKSITIP